MGKIGARAVLVKKGLDGRIKITAKGLQAAKQGEQESLNQGFTQGRPAKAAATVAIQHTTPNKVHNDNVQSITM